MPAYGLPTMPNRRCQFVIALLCLCLPMHVAIASATIEQRLRQATQAADLKDTQVAIMVMDLDSRKVLAAIDADQPVIPASNMKLITTAAALDMLGPDFAFQTTLALVNNVQPGERPSLLIKGDGDPAFGDPVLLQLHELTIEDLLDHWVNAVLNTPHRHFAQLLVDDHVFDDQFVHDTWPENQLHRGYAAQVAGLNFHQNVVHVMLIPSREPGQAVSARLFPESSYMRTINRATTGSRHEYWVDRRIGGNDLVFGGSVRETPPAPVAVTVHDPPLFLAHVLKRRFEQAGITIDAIQRAAPQASTDELQPLHVVRTLLPAVLDRTNQDSQNLFAEALLKRLGHAMTAAPGSWDNGSAAVRLALRNRLGPGSAVVQVADGSGLSRENRVTARLMVQLLQSLHDDDDPQRYQLFQNSLATAGQDGTLSTRMANLQSTIHAKSGYIHSVSALSGYILLPTDDDQPQRTIAFSFIFNGFQPPHSNAQMRRLQDSFIRIIEAELLAQRDASPADAHR